MALIPSRERLTEIGKYWWVGLLRLVLIEIVIMTISQINLVLGVDSSSNF